MTGIILAGGENRRMGRDKAFLALDGRPLIEHVLDVVKRLFREIIVVTNSPHAYAKYDVKLVSDAIDKRGPLTGIYSGLASSTSEFNFVVACDMPFLHAGLIAYMQRQAEGFDIVVPEIDGQVEPLHAIYHKRLVPVIDTLLRIEQRKIRKIIENAAVRRIMPSEIDRFDPERRSFINLNTPKDYKEAACLDWEQRN